LDWIKLGTAAAAFAAIGSLVFTAIATYYGAMVSRDQLEQSREDADRELRSQAARVSYWVENQGGSPRVHILNRSPDPISNVTVKFMIPIETDDPFEGPWVLFQNLLLSLGPCSQATIPWSALSYSVGRTSERPPDKSAYLARVLVWFVDRDGTIWARTQTRLDSTRDIMADWDMIKLGGEDGVPWGKIHGDPKVTSLTGCGNSAS
jgi:hypothetical protein